MKKEEIKKISIFIFHVFIFSFFFFISSFIFAQTLTLEQARVLALANSRSLAKYELAIKSSILDERNSLYSMLPSLSADYRASMNYMEDWAFVNPVDTFYAGANFSVTQVIFAGGKSFLQKALNKISTESTRKDALAEYFNVLDAIDNAFYAALEAAETLEAEESSLQTAVFGLSVAQVREESGMINQGDYLRALADKESRENSCNNARRNLSLAMTRLKTLTGIKENNIQMSPVDFSAYDDVLQFLAGISDGEADLLFARFWELTYANNPALAKAALNNERAEKNHTITKRDWSPRISASIFATGLSYTTERGFNSTGSGGVSITGSIPVDFWTLANRINKSEIALASAAIDYANTEISLENELYSALLNAFAQAGSVLSSRRSLEYTEKHFEYVMERYRLLQASVSDMQDASSLLITSRNNLTRASYGFLQSISRLRSLTAIDDEETLIRLFLLDAQ